MNGKQARQASSRWTLRISIPETMDFSFHYSTTPLSSLPLLVLEARLSFFPRYYLVSTPLCHSSTKFEAFIECLRTEDRPQTPATFTSILLPLSLPLSFSRLFRSDFPPTISLSLSLSLLLRLFLFVHFSQQLSSFLAPSV